MQSDVQHTNFISQFKRFTQAASQQASMTIMYQRYPSTSTSVSVNTRNSIVIPSKVVSSLANWNQSNWEQMTKSEKEFSWTVSTAKAQNTQRNNEPSVNNWAHSVPDTFTIHISNFGSFLIFYCVRVFVCAFLRSISASDLNAMTIKIESCHILFSTMFRTVRAFLHDNQLHWISN